MTGRWVPPDQRDAVVDCVRSLHTRTPLCQDSCRMTGAPSPVL